MNRLGNVVLKNPFNPANKGRFCTTFKVRKISTHFEAGLLHKSLIYATDFNEVVLQQAKNGAFSLKSFELFKQHYEAYGGGEDFTSYFNFYKGFFVVKKELKDRILFFKHNLATDGPLNEFSIIFCRNVLIYFDEKLTYRVVNLFELSLEDGGFLVLGEAEDLKREHFRALDVQHKIFQKGA